MAWAVVTTVCVKAQIMGARIELGRMRMPKSRAHSRTISYLHASRQMAMDCGVFVALGLVALVALVAL